MSGRTTIRAIAAAMLLAVGVSAHSGGGVSAEPEPGLPWSGLVFESQRQLIKARVEALMESVSSEEAKPALTNSPQGEPLSPGGPEVLVLKIKSVIEGLLVGRQGHDITVWFDPVTGAGLQRERLRRGNKPDSKFFRFTHRGVYRMRRKPLDQSEVALSPERWTRTKESFYPHPEQARDCEAVTESSILLYKLSVMPITDNDAAPSMCVFHQQRVHLVTVQRRGEERLTVDFGQGPRETTAVKLVLQARPLDPDQTDEPFEFLGLQGEIEMLMAADPRIPVKISGNLPPVGRVMLDLREALPD